MVLVTPRKALEVFREEDGNSRGLPLLVFSRVYQQGGSHRPASVPELMHL